MRGRVAVGLLCEKMVLLLSPRPRAAKERCTERSSGSAAARRPAVVGGARAHRPCGWGRGATAPRWPPVSDHEWSWRVPWIASILATFSFFPGMSPPAVCSRVGGRRVRGRSGTVKLLVAGREKRVKGG